MEYLTIKLSIITKVGKTKRIVTEWSYIDVKQAVIQKVYLTPRSFIDLAAELDKIVGELRSKQKYLTRNRHFARGGPPDCIKDPMLRQEKSA